MFLLAFALVESNSSRVSIYPECSLLGGFDLARPGFQALILQCVIFMSDFDVVLRAFCDCLSVGLTSA